MFKKSVLVVIALFLFFTSGLCLAQEGSNKNSEGPVVEKYGLVIGITEYKQDKLKNLPAASTDAEEFYELLRNKGGFKSENVVLLADREATTRRINEELTNLASKTTKKDIVIIFYSGQITKGSDFNGDEEDDFDEYFVTHGTDPTNSNTLYKTAYRDDVFTEKALAIPSDRTVIFLDGCYSAGGVDISDNNVSSGLVDLQGTVLFASSQEEQVSYSAKRYNNGAFTFYLLKGLQGEADVDNDSIISLKELESYVSPKVEKFTDENFPSPQKPTVKGSKTSSILHKSVSLRGKVKYVTGSGAKKAGKGDYVVINLGSADGTEEGDEFEVIPTSQDIDSNGLLKNKLRLTDVVGPHLAIAKVLTSQMTVEVGYHVKRKRDSSPDSQHNLQPVSFVFSPSKPRINQSVRFNTVLNHSGSPVNEYNWSFGDGSSSSNQNPTHKFTKPGKYVVMLTVTFENGARSTATESIEVKGKPKAGFTVEVMDSSGDSLDARIYLDDKYQGGTGRDGGYTIADLPPGSYEVKANLEHYEKATETVYLSAGESESIDLKLQNRGRPVNATLAYSPQQPKVGQEVNFAYKTSNSDPAERHYEWSFGDGTESIKKNPIHRYSEPGNYTAMLTVHYTDGSKITLTEQVTVEKGTAKLTIKVIDDSKTPLNSRIYLDGSLEGWSREGEFIQSDISPGSHTVKAKKESYLQETKTVHLSAGGHEQLTLTLKKENKLPDEGQVKIDKRYALVVGVTEYKNFSLSGLQYPAKDAKTFKKFLLDSGFKKENIITLLNKEATSDNFGNTLRRLVSRSDEDDQVVIYYSGHGASGPDENGDEQNYSPSDTHDEYFATYDTNPRDIYLTAYSDDQFSNQISSLDAKEVLIFLDSCFAGGATKGVKGINKGVSVDNVFSDLGFGGSKVTLFAASRQTQNSYESQKLGHGVFTYYLLEGLKSKADQNSDGIISGKELENYLPSRVSEFVEENNLPEKKRGTPQQPLVKGNVNKNLIRYPKEYTTRIVSVQGKKKKAKNDDYVLINKGSKDGVTPGDVFEVHLTEQTKEGTVVFDKFTARIEVTSVSGPHLSICRVKKTDFYLREDFVVEKK